MKLLKLTRPDGLSVAINADAICMFTPPVSATKGAHTLFYLMNGTQAVTESFVEIMEMLNALPV